MIKPTQIFKCLSDETRLRCLMLIQHEGPLCVCELTTALQDIQPKISRHLAQLRKCGLLVSHRQGQWMFYHINSDLPLWSRSLLEELTHYKPEFLAENLQYLNNMDGRPERV